MAHKSDHGNIKVDWPYADTNGKGGKANNNGSSNLNYRYAITTGGGGKTALHRRGMSLDETRVQSGLVGVATSEDAPSSIANSSHRRVHSHDSATYYSQSSQKQQPRYHISPHPSSYLNNTEGIANSQAASASTKINPKTHSQLSELTFVNNTMEALEDQIRKDDAPKKKRTRTTPEQLRILQKAFNFDPMPTSNARITLAKKLGMNVRAVQVWFQNKRAKAKLEAKRGSDGSGRSSSGTESPHYDDCDSVDGSSFGGVSSHNLAGDLIQSSAYDNSYKATSRSLKATGMVGRMAFPSDLDHFNVYNNQHHHMGRNSNQYMHQNHQNHRYNSRSFSLPYIEGDYTNQVAVGGLCDTPDGSLSLSEGIGGTLSRSDSTQFAPYEFASGSFDLAADDCRGTLSRCQSLPVDVFEDTTAANLVDLLPPMDDPVWPRMDPIAEQVSLPSYHHQQAYNMRRSLSLPNVYQPEFFSQHHSTAIAQGFPDGEEDDVVNNMFLSGAEDCIVHPENLNDFLTDRITPFDD